MRRAHLLLGLCAIAVAASLVLALRKADPAPGGSAPTMRPAAGDPPEAEGQAGSFPVAFPARRAADPTPGRAPATEDPCASARVELEVERAARAAAEGEVARLREELARVERELTALRSPEDTPYGAFLAGPEAEAMLENIRSGSSLYAALLDDLRKDVQRCELRIAQAPSPQEAQLLDALSRRLQRVSEDREAAVEYVLGGIRAVLDEFPVRLRPGEATWIADHVVLGSAGDGELVRFLGPSRLAAELPLDELFERHLWNEDYGLAIQAALPPEKLAELEAAIRARAAEAAGDPEEIAWLRERFPSFFD